MLLLPATIFTAIGARASTGSTLFKTSALENIAMDSAITTIGLAWIRKVRVASSASRDQQRAIAGHWKSADEYLFTMGDQSEKLRANRQGLNPDLLAGKVHLCAD